MKILSTGPFEPQSCRFQINLSEIMSYCENRQKMFYWIHMTLSDVKIRILIFVAISYPLGKHIGKKLNER